MYKNRLNNPYFHELKGQMYYETGLFKKAIESFLISNRMLPNEKGVSIIFSQVSFIIATT